MPCVRGIVERITFRNESNFYTVLRLRPEGKPELVTVVGTFPAIAPGEVIEVEGEWVAHPEYGYQLKVVSYNSVVPASSAAIERYLGSGLVKGIGPVAAKRIVARFGDETLEIIEKDPGRLMEVEGIGPAKRDAIVKAFAEQKEIRRITLFLAEYGIGPNYAIRLFKHYGNGAVEAVRSDPYRLADEVYGIGFKTADRIARSLGVDSSSPERISHGIFYALGEACSSEGHVFLPEKVLAKEASELLGVEEELTESGITDLIRRRRLVAEDFGIEEGLSIYPYYHYYAEVRTAGRLLELLRGPVVSFGAEFDRKLAAVEAGLGFSLSPGQREALGGLRNSGLFVLTGGPGTGKTTVLKAAVATLEALGQKVMLAAPTGRAARRLGEATGRQARTVHRLLELKRGPSGFEFGRNEDNPLSCDAVVVDEASMVDLNLMDSLLRAMIPGMRLILVGDVDQLASVGPGAVLRDIIESGAAPVIRLTEIFRQARTSTIVLNAHRINHGEFPICTASAREDLIPDFFFIEEEVPERITEVVVDLVSRRLPRYLGCDPREDIQVITPMKRTETGVENLNSLIRDRINPPNEGKGEITFSEVSFREGDKVMQVRNNYDKFAFNGDIGSILRIDGEAGEVTVGFPDADGTREVTYERDELDELVLAYAISVHKSQGSEFRSVVMPVTTQHYVMLRRNLLYTGITRGKELVVLVGTKRALAIAVKNAQAQERYTGLARRLGGGVHG